MKRCFMATTNQTKGRDAERVLSATRTLEGAGLLVNRPFPTAQLTDFDPFLLLDEMGPAELGPNEAKGAPDHPHRGFETVTYLVAGKMQHRDSQGHAGVLRPGDVQWMTAGGGVIHSEMPEDGFFRTGGRMHGFQLWVNLPRRDKMMQPRYQEIPREKIPAAVSADGTITVRVIAGEAMKVKAVIDTRTPIMMLHYTLALGASVVQPTPRDFNVFAYVFAGSGTFGSNERGASAHQMVLFSNDSDSVSISSPAESTEPLEVLVIGGAPLREPVVRYGPFVMNTDAEISQAIEDYRNGKMGQIAAV
jgi:redox-sensitive bicupin YhaK (pirin superfamily)